MRNVLMLVTLCGGAFASPLLADDRIIARSPHNALPPSGNGKLERRTSPARGPNVDCHFIISDSSFTPVFAFNFGYYVRQDDGMDIIHYDGVSVKAYSTGQSPDHKTIQHCFRFAKNDDWIVLCFRFLHGAPLVTSWYFDQFYTTETKNDFEQIGTITCVPTADCLRTNSIALHRISTGPLTNFLQRDNNSY
ncbi:uncharacterized protein L969DRAFT_88142 [Mixia osmundae IAM 14324]|uniref:uncharacterized protein n=1 Tax=Mixia osmundae (strain CBS 9802 / IAM 14324 / JCM 22182 / KY 12970) TaxID=764103 RepID=UPI0004A553EE|nr:uncharacterized protein L969DRAFT_88142 [Mixia osmundae IAM 14324]KEI38815.1 hypothetical protein L969DRAFT_88142 [Mixia osmundae IAM 14324]